MVTCEAGWVEDGGVTVVDGVFVQGGLSCERSH